MIVELGSAWRHRLPVDHLAGTQRLVAGSKLRSGVTALANCSAIPTTDGTSSMAENTGIKRAVQSRHGSRSLPHASKKLRRMTSISAALRNDVMTAPHKSRTTENLSRSKPRSYKLQTFVAGSECDEPTIAHEHGGASTLRLVVVGPMPCESRRSPT